MIKNHGPMLGRLDTRSIDLARRIQPWALKSKRNNRARNWINIGSASVISTTGSSIIRVKWHRDVKMIGPVNVRGTTDRSKEVRTKAT